MRSLRPALALEQADDRRLGQGLEMGVKTDDGGRDTGTDIERLGDRKNREEGAVLIVLVFERIIPPGREPPFLAQPALRPILAKAGQEGLRKLPQDVTDFIDGTKRERGL